MKAWTAIRLGLVMGGMLMTASAWAQMPGGGMAGGPGFGEHRPPMEKAFGPEGDHGRWWNNPKMVERLKLSDEQRKSFDGIFYEHRQTLVDLRASVEKAEIGMEPLVSSDQPNEARILAQIDKLAQARAELEKANARFLLAIRAKLTPEQWKLVQNFRANHGQERGGWDQGGRGPNGQGVRQPGLGAQFRQKRTPPMQMPPPPPDGTPDAPAGPGSTSGSGAATVQ